MWVRRSDAHKPMVIECIYVLKTRASSHNSLRNEFRCVQVLVQMHSIMNAVDKNDLSFLCVEQYFSEYEKNRINGV